MHSHSARKLADAFRVVRSNTIDLAEAIPESDYAFTAAPDTRSIAALLAHIACVDVVPYAIHRGGITDLAQLNFWEVLATAHAEEATPRTKAELIAMLRARGEAFASWLEQQPDAFLAEPVAMPPGATPSHKERFEMLMSAKEHEMHHRGQLTMLARMRGVVPPLTQARRARMPQQGAASSTTA